MSFRSKARFTRVKQAQEQAPGMEKFPLSCFTNVTVWTGWLRLLYTCEPGLSLHGLAWMTYIWARYLVIAVVQWSPVQRVVDVGTPRGVDAADVQTTQVQTTLLVLTMKRAQGRELHDTGVSLMAARRKNYPAEKGRWLPGDTKGVPCKQSLFLLGKRVGVAPVSPRGRGSARRVQRAPNAVEVFVARYCKTTRQRKRWSLCSEVAFDASSLAILRSRIYSRKDLNPPKHRIALKMSTSPPPPPISSTSWGGRGERERSLINGRGHPSISPPGRKTKQQPVVFLN